MDDQHITDLKGALSNRLLNTPYSPSGHTPEHILIRKLIEVVTEADVGHIDPWDFRTILKNNPIPRWSWDTWLADMVAEGVYSEHIWDTGDEDS